MVTTLKRIWQRLTGTTPGKTQAELAEKYTHFRARLQGLPGSQSSNVPDHGSIGESRLDDLDSLDRVSAELQQMIWAAQVPPAPGGHPQPPGIDPPAAGRPH